MDFLKIQWFLASELGLILSIVSIILTYKTADAFVKSGLKMGDCLNKKEMIL